MSEAAIDPQAFAWARLQACEWDMAACRALLDEAAARGGRLPIRDAALIVNMTTTTTRGLAGRLVESGLACLAHDSIYLLPLKRKAVRA